MSAAVLPSPSDTDVRRIRFTRTDVDRMLEAGVLEGRRFELIGGELIEKMGQSPFHIYVLRILQAWLAGMFGKRVQVQSPIEAGPNDREFSLPEPDLCVLAEAKPEYAGRLVRCAETLLIVEVADTSLRHDTVTKRDLYARAGAPEYWVVNIQNREVIVYRDLSRGRYRQVTTFAAGDTVSLECAPDNPVPVASIFGDGQ